MSTIRLRRIGPEYRNECYRTIGGIFPLQHVVPSNVKKGNSARVSYERLPETKWQSNEWHRTTSPKKEPKTVLSAGKVMGIVFWDSEGGILVNFLKKGETNNAARYVQTLKQTSSRASWKTSEEENCHPSTWQRETSHCTSDLADNSKERLGSVFPSTLQFRLAPPQTTTCSGPWNIARKVTKTTLTRQSKKPCEVGCEEVERTSTAEEFFRFCNVGRNA
jgi:hypothetical protein